MKKILLTSILLLTAMSLPCGAFAVAENPEALVEAGIQQEVQISLSGSTLRIVGAAGQTVEIYNVTGVRVLSRRLDPPDQTLSLSLPRGCYIVKVGKTVRKITIQ